MLPRTEDGESGFQFCNLTEINGGQCITLDALLRACKAGAILGTLQSGYTNFTYVSDATRKITERESLLGVSITGWMGNPKVLFDENNMIAGATMVRDVNKQVAKMIGIPQAARTTCVKPSGNASIILGTDSGIHGAHASKYFRHVQMNDDDEVARIITQVNPKMVERSVWSSNGTDVVVAFPVVSKPGSIYKSELLGVKQLEYVKKAQQFWVEYGTNYKLSVDKRLRHNVSNTISVDNWDEVEQYIYDNRAFFAGISLMSASGDKAYVQAPFTEVVDHKQIMKLYGEGSLFASGLIVDANHAFNNNLWQACDTVMGYGLNMEDDSIPAIVLKRDWVRRAIKFADTYFKGNLEQMTFCLKDCNNLHKWNNIVQSIKPIDFATDLLEKTFVDADSLGSQGCAGGACEIAF
jgi:ribonucleoside-diphosphate reductase alpha chain